MFLFQKLSFFQSCAFYKSEKKKKNKNQEGEVMWGAEKSRSNSKEHPIRSQHISLFSISEIVWQT